MIVHASGLKLLLLLSLLFAHVEQLLLSKLNGTVLGMNHIHRVELTLDMDVLSTTGARLEGSGLVGVSVGYSAHVWEGRGDVGLVCVILLLLVRCWGDSGGHSKGLELLLMLRASGVVLCKRLSAFHQFGELGERSEHGGDKRGEKSAATTGLPRRGAIGTMTMGEKERTWAGLAGFISLDCCGLNCCCICCI